MFETCLCVPKRSLSLLLPVLWKGGRGSQAYVSNIVRRGKENTMPPNKSSHTLEGSLPSLLKPFPSREGSSSLTKVPGNCWLIGWDSEWCRGGELKPTWQWGGWVKAGASTATIVKPTSRKEATGRTVQLLLPCVGKGLDWGSFNGFSFPLTCLLPAFPSQCKAELGLPIQGQTAAFPASLHSCHVAAPCLLLPKARCAGTFT